jgi:hypothetical protein
VDLDTEFFERLVLSLTVGLGLHELNKHAFHSAAGSPDQNAEGGGGLALPVAGVYHKQAFCVLAIILAAPLVSLFLRFCHSK